MSWLFSKAMVEAYENSRFSQALVEASLAATSSDGERSAQLSVMPTQHPFWRSDKTIDFSTRSPFGQTCQVLTADRGEALLMSYRAGFRAKTSAVRARSRASRARDPDSGWKWPASFARFDPATSTWKTRQSCLVEGLETFSATWPEWGSMLDGESLAAPNVERPKPGLASGLLPTLTASDAKGARNGTAKGRTLSAGLTMTDWLWLNVGQGMLHPESAEWTMLWPIGWTALAPLAMDRFQSWQQQHGGCSADPA